MTFHQPQRHIRSLNAPLTEDQLFAVAPSIFARTAHESRSERFAPVPTIDWLRALAVEGFLPYEASQGSTRTPGKAAYTAHSVRLRRPDDIYDWVNKTRGDVLPDIILANANDGTRAADIFAGMTRIVCLNGLVVSDGAVPSVKVGHVGRAVDKIIEGTYRVVEDLKRVIGVRDHWASVPLSLERQREFATRVHALRWPTDEEGKATTAIQASALTVARRTEDLPETLWHVFNRVQENVVAGGLESRRTLASGRTRLVKSRAVNATRANIALNQGIWAIAEEFAAAA